MDLGGLNPMALKDRAMSWIDLVKSLPFDGGPSATRWVFVRVAEVLSLVIVMLAVGGVVRYWRFGTADAIYMGALTFMATSLIGFAQWTQKTKLMVDSKTPGSDSAIESGPLSSTMVEEVGK